MAEMKLENVCYRYKNAEGQVLKGVSAVFKSGELCAVIGPSGSGKSTLLSLMAGLDTPTEGEIVVDGESLKNKDLDLYRRKQIAMIFQSFHLFPLLRVIENVCYPMEINGVKKKTAEGRAAELLELMGISAEKHKRFPMNLSGGEQQRVAIARALSSGAGLLLGDEPTGNLDRKNTEHILKILKELADKKGYCVVIVTHDMQAAEVADHVWRMKDGILVAEK